MCNTHYVLLPTPLVTQVCALVLDVLASCLCLYTCIFKWKGCMQCANVRCHESDAHVVTRSEL